MLQELEASQGQVSELVSLLSDAQKQLGRAERHRALAREQLDAQEQDFGRLGRDLQKVLPSSLFCPNPCVY